MTHKEASSSNTHRLPTPVWQIETEPLDFQCANGRMILPSRDELRLLDATTGRILYHGAHENTAFVVWVDTHGFALGAYQSWTGFSWDGEVRWTRPNPGVTQIDLAGGLQLGPVGDLHGSGLGLLNKQFVRVDIRTGDVEPWPNAPVRNVRYATTRGDVVWGLYTEGEESYWFRWERDNVIRTPFPHHTEPHVGGNVLVHATFEAPFSFGYQARNASTLQSLWELPTKPHLRIAVSETAVLLATDTHELRCLNPADGRERWVCTTAKALLRPPAMQDDLIVVSGALLDPVDGSAYVRSDWVKARSDSERLYLLRSKPPRRVEAYRIADLLDLMVARRAG